MFIQTESTPNPATLKFLPGQDVLGSGSANFTDAASAVRSSMAKRLFTVDGVAGVFLGSDFITITKDDTDSSLGWEHLKPMVLGAIMDHYASGDPAMDTPDQDMSDHADHEGPDGEIVAQIKELLDTRVRPAVAQDGGDIVFHGFKDGIVSLHMQGACAGCPSSTITLKNGIENMLRHYIPAVQEVRQI